MSAPCRFTPLREHKPSECPLCNPTGWMATPDDAPVSRVQAIEAAEDRAEQVAFDSWRERGL